MPTHNETEIELVSTSYARWLMWLITVAGVIAFLSEITMWVLIHRYKTLHTSCTIDRCWWLP
jgi:hypothetical protein